MDVEGEEVGEWARQNHVWLFETVSGAGGWKAGKDGRSKSTSTKFSTDNTGSAVRNYCKNSK
jgi:hypothetical protein